MIAVFSNYSVYSIYYSEDAGGSWLRAGGNLEANTVGTGNGPSVRWVSIVPSPNGRVYIASTSVGLFGTNQLDGLNTIWTQLAPDEIGSLVVDMTDYRTDDGLVIAGTHGGGVYSAYITDTLQTGSPSLAQSRSSISVFPNPATKQLNVFFPQTGEIIRMNLYDSNGRLIRNIRQSLNNGMMQIDISGLQEGAYYISGGKQVVKFIKID